MPDTQRGTDELLFSIVRLYTSYRFNRVIVSSEFDPWTHIDYRTLP